MKDTEDYTIQVVSPNVVILVGGLHTQTPNSYMKKVVRKITKMVGTDRYTEYIDSHLDNPWVRVLVFDIDSLPFDDSLESIKEKIKIKNTEDDDCA